MSEPTTTIQFQEFDVKDTDDAFNRWIRWITKFKRYLVHKKIEDDKLKINDLFLFGGFGLEDLYTECKKENEEKASKQDSKLDKESKQSKESEPVETFESIIETISAHFNPEANRLLNQYSFRALVQYQDEPFDEFVGRLKDQASTCGFTKPEEEITAQILQMCKSDALKEKILRKRKKIELAELIKLGRLDETIESHLALTKAKRLNRAEVEDEYEPKHEAKISQIQREQQPERQAQARPTKSQSCFYCGGSYPHKSQCPAKGKTCENCGKLNHLASVCRSKADNQKTQPKRVHVKAVEVDSDSNSSVASAWMVKTVNAIKSLFMPLVTLFICQTWVSICIDTGAQVNIMDEPTFSKLKAKPNTFKPRVTLFRYNDTKPMVLLCEFTTRVSYNGTYRSVSFVVVKGSGGNLLSYETSVQLGIINEIRAIHKESY